MPPTIVSGDRATANFATGREKPDFAEGIALLDADIDPFTLLTMKAGRGTSGNTTHQWIEDELMPMTDQVNYSTGYSNSATGIVVDNASRFALGDLVKHNESQEVVLVTSVGSTFIGVIRDYGQSAEAWTARAAALEDNDYLEVIGNAFEQGHPLPSIRSTVEVIRKNYCQNQRTPTGISHVAGAAELFGDGDEAHQLRKIAKEHSLKLEKQNLWGRPVLGDRGLYVAATGNVDPTTAGGLWHYISEYAPAENKVSQADITQSEFMAFLEAGFAHGSSQKVMLTPPILRSALDSWGIAKLNTFSEKTLFGMNVAQWVSSHGTVVFVTHKGLKDPSSTVDGAFSFLVDLENIKWITYNKIGATRLNKLDPYAATGKTLDEWEYITYSCLELKLPATHAALYGMVSYS